MAWHYVSKGELPCLDGRTESHCVIEIQSLRRGVWCRNTENGLDWFDHDGNIIGNVDKWCSDREFIAMEQEEQDKESEHLNHTCRMCGKNLEKKKSYYERFLDEDDRFCSKACVLKCLSVQKVYDMECKHCGRQVKEFARIAITGCCGADDAPGYFDIFCSEKCAIEYYTRKITREERER